MIFTNSPPSFLRSPSVALYAFRMCLSRVSCSPDACVTVPVLYITNRCALDAKCDPSTNVFPVRV